MVVLLLFGLDFGSEGRTYHREPKHQNNVEMTLKHLSMKLEVCMDWDPFVGGSKREGTFFFFAFLRAGEWEREEEVGKGTEHCGTVGNSCKSSFYLLYGPRTFHFTICDLFSRVNASFESRVSMFTDRALFGG